MKANITNTISEIGIAPAVRLNVQPHNVRFLGASDKHILDFAIDRFPRKVILEYLTEAHGGDIVANLRAVHCA